MTIYVVSTNYIVDLTKTIDMHLECVCVSKFVINQTSFIFKIIKNVHTYCFSPVCMYSINGRKEKKIRCQTTFVWIPSMEQL